MARLEGWDKRLAQVIESARDKPYQLGEHDCFRVTCQTVEALTGVNRWPDFAGYKTVRDALALIARHGPTFERAFDRFFGSPNVDVRCARRGDIVAVAAADGQKHLGVCLGSQSAVLQSTGLQFVPTMTCLCAWRVG